MSYQTKVDLSNGAYAAGVVLVDAAGNSVNVAPVSAPSNSTQASVTSAIADTVILAANAARKGAIIYNESTAVLYLLLSSGVSSATAYSLQIPAQGSFTLKPSDYSGVIKGLWSAANGFARVTEFS